MASSSKREDLFASLPKFDPDALSPPAWAKDVNKSFSSGGERSSHSQREPSDEDSESDEEATEVWEDALEAHEPTTEPEFLRFTDDEMQVCAVTLGTWILTLQRLFDKGLKEKERGNSLFTASPPETDEALVAYKQGLDYLPKCPKLEQKQATVPPPPPNGGIQEVTEDEAAEIERAEATKDQTIELSKREKVEEEIRQLQKVLWANVGACYNRKVGLNQR